MLISLDCFQASNHKYFVNTPVRSQWKATKTINAQHMKRSGIIHPREEEGNGRSNGSHHYIKEAFK